MSRPTGDRPADPWEQTWLELARQGDEAAFAALVRRHGPMVWGVCRRLLHYHDAQDAFQATFLVLFRKAASILPREMVANWLHGVARQTALQARRTAARRGARERQVTEMPEAAGVEQDLWNDLQPLVDQQLSRLPDLNAEYMAVDEDGSENATIHGIIHQTTARTLSTLTGVHVKLKDGQDPEGLKKAVARWRKWLVEQEAE